MEEVHIFLQTFANPLTLIFLGISSLVSILSIIWFWKYRGEFLKSLKLSKDLIKALKSFQPTSNNKSNRKLIDFPAGSSPAQGNLRNWMQANLSGIEVIDNQEQMYATLRYNKFVLFSYPPELQRPIPKNPIGFIPAVHTAIGVMGTFVGITISLSGVNRSTIGGIDDAAILRTQEGVSNVLDGMQTAFGTSLIGLLSSVFFMFLISRQNGDIFSIREKIKKDLDELVIIETSNQLLSKANMVSGDASNRELVLLVTELKRDLLTFKMPSTEEIAKAVAIGINQVTKKEVSPILTDIRQELVQTKEILSIQNQDNLKNIIESLRLEVFEPVIERLDRTADITRQASQAVSSLKEELGGITTSLSASVATIQRFQEDTLVKLQSFAQTLQDTLRLFQDDTKGVLTSVAQEIKRGVDRSIEGLNLQREAFERSASNISSTFIEIGGTLRESFDQQVDVQESMLNKVNERTEGILTNSQQLFTQQNETLREVGTNASHLMNQARQELETSLSAMQQGIENSRQSMQQQLADSSQQYRETMQAFFDSGREGIDHQRSAFEQSTQSISASFGEIREELETSLQRQVDVQESMLNKVNERTEGILTNSQQLFTQQNETLREVGTNAVLLMNGAKENLEGTLQNVDSMLQQTRQTVQDELSNFRFQYQAALSSFFEEQNNLLEGTLGEQREGLKRVVDSLDAVFKDEEERITQSMDKIRDTTETVVRMLNTLGLADGSRLVLLTELNRKAVDQMNRLEQSYRGLVEQLEGTLQRSNLHISETLEKAWRHEERFFSEAADATAQISSTLLETANYILVSAEQIQEATSRRGN
jgi:hypothetical protein